MLQMRDRQEMVVSLTEVQSTLFIGKAWLCAAQAAPTLKHLLECEARTAS